MVAPQQKAGSRNFAQSHSLTENNKLQKGFSPKQTDTKTPSTNAQTINGRVPSNPKYSSLLGQSLPTTTSTSDEGNSKRNLS